MTIKTIMIIDDSEADQFIARKAILKLWPSAQLLKAYNGEEALKTLEKEETQPDLIILDINMPVMNGPEFLEEYTKQTQQAKMVVILTSSELQSDMETTQKHEIVKACIPRPLRETDLQKIQMLYEETGH